MREGWNESEEASPVREAVKEAVRGDGRKMRKS